jgi:uncharacterized damage-inducible protein DinB
MSGTLLELFRHKTWATLQLINYCRELSDEDLDATIPGVFGTIRETLQHLVDSEEGYFRIVTTERLFEPLSETLVPLAELARRIRALAPRWEALAQDASVADRECTTSDGWRVPGSVPMAQAIHHADDHRSHVLSILGARGLPTPEPNGLDMWGYAEAKGLMRPVG